MLKEKDELSVLISGQLNIERTVKNINTQLKSIEKISQLKTIKINVELDHKKLNDLKNQIKQIQVFNGTTILQHEKAKTAELQKQLDLYKQHVMLKNEASSSTQGGTGQQTSLSFVDFSSKLVGNLSSVVEGPLSTFFGPLLEATVSIMAEAVGHVNELNRSLTELSVLWNKNQSEVADFGEDLQRMSVGMSVSTNELARNAAELARQGLNQEDAFKRMRTIVEYAKTSNLSFEESAKIIAATLKSTGVTAERAADVFSYLGDSTGKGADHIGQAMQRISGSGSALGLEFEKVSSWIAVVSSRSRESASTIGSSINSILVRMQSLKDIGFDVQDGTKASQVAKAFAEVGIELKDSQGNFRDFAIMMDELGAKWGALEARQKVYIATTVAGINQQQGFMNLMEGYSESIELYKNAMDSAGITHEKYQLYQEGTAAKMDRLKASLDGLYQRFLDSSMIDGAIISLTKLSETYQSLTEDSDSLAMSLFKTIPFVRDSTFLVDYFKGVAERDALEKRINNQTEVITKSLSTKREEVIQLIEAYKELNKNSEFHDLFQAKEYLEIQTKLAKLMPTFVDYYDQKGQVVLKASSALEQELKIAEEIYRTETERRTQNGSNEYEKKIRQITEQKKQVEDIKQQIIAAKTNGDIDLIRGLNFEYDEAQSKLSRLKSSLSADVNDLQNIQNDISGIKLGDEYKKIIDGVITSLDFSEMNFDEAQEKLKKLYIYVEAFENFETADNITPENKTKAFKSIEQVINDLLGTFDNSGKVSRNFINALHQVGEAATKVIDPFSRLAGSQARIKESYEEAAKGISPYNQLLQDLADGKAISAEKAAEMIMYEEDLANAIIIENGVVKINKELVEQLRDAKIKAFIDVGQQEIESMNIAKEAHIEKMSMYIEEMKGVKDLATARSILNGKLDDLKQNNDLLGDTGIVANRLYKKKLENDKQEIDEIAKTINTAQARVDAAKASFGSVGRSTPKSDSRSGSKSKSDYPSMTEDAIKLKEAEQKLASIRQEQSKWVPYSPEYRKELDNEREKIEEIIALKEKELAVIEKRNQKAGTSKSSTNTEPNEKALALLADIEKYKGELEEVATKSEKGILAGYTKDIQEIDNALEANKEAYEMLDKATGAYRDGLDADISLYEAKKIALENEQNQLTELEKKYATNSIKSAEYNNSLKQTEKALRSVNKELSDKKAAKFNSFIDEQQELLAVLNRELESSKERMSSMAEGSEAWNNELSQQNEILLKQSSINGAMIAQTKLNMAQMANAGQKGTQEYKNLENQLINLQSAQIGYNNAIRDNQALRIQKINEKWDKDVAKEVETARRLRDEIVKNLQKLTETGKNDFDPAKIKSSIASALTKLKNLRGEFVIDPKVKSLDSFEDLEKRINEYTKNIDKIHKKSEELFKQNGTKSEVVEIIEKEAREAAKLNKEIKETNTLLDKKRLQYEQIEKSLEYQISLIEKERDKIVQELQDKMEVPIEIDWEKLKDDLVDFGQTGKLVIDDIVLDLDNATVIGDVSSDPVHITKDIVGGYKNILEMTKAFEQQKAILEEQQTVREKLLELEKQGKEETKEYVRLKKELEKLDKKAFEAREDMQKSIEKEIELLNGLRDQEKSIREEIQERETVYKRQAEAIERQIESTKKLYDDQIKAQRDKLDLFDEENEKIDRQIERTKLLQELENARNDKRYEYINKNGEVELTYDKGKVANLEQELKDFDLKTVRDDKRKQLEDSIKILEEARNNEIDRLEQYKENLKITHDKEIAQLNFYLNQNKALQDQLTSNIDNHIKNLQLSYDKEIEFQNYRLENMRVLHEAELVAMEAYLEGLEQQLVRINENIADKVSDLSARLDENIDHFAENAWALGLLARDIKKLAEQVTGIDELEIDRQAKAYAVETREKAKRERLGIYHNGGIVGHKEPSRIAKLANKIFNVGPDETVIKSLIGELQIPPVNLAKNFKPAMQNFASQIMTGATGSTHSVISQDQHYQINVERVVANNPMEFIRGLNLFVKANQV